MGADRAGLSEEYEMLKAAGATDACYGSLLYRHEPSIRGSSLSCWVEMSYRKHAVAKLQHQTDTNYHSSFFHQLCMNGDKLVAKGNKFYARHFASLEEEIFSGNDIQ